jgi:hypothetical protein
MSERDERDESRLRERIRQTIKGMPEPVDPFDVANKVLDEMDVRGSVKSAMPEYYLAAHLCLRHLAREVLRNERVKNGKARPSPAVVIGASLPEPVMPSPLKEPVLPWDDPRLADLQENYPVAPDKERRGYIAREKMDEADWRHNLHCLITKIVGEQCHHDSLEAWGVATRGWDADGDRDSAVSA